VQVLPGLGIPPDATQHWYVFLDVLRQSLYASISQDEPLGWALATAEYPSAAPPTMIMTVLRVAGRKVRKRFALLAFMICSRPYGVACLFDSHIGLKVPQPCILLCHSMRSTVGHIKAKRPQFAAREIVRRGGVDSSCGLFGLRRYLAHG
jgi:hypothetical protein